MASAESRGPRTALLQNECSPTVSLCLRSPYLTVLSDPRIGSAGTKFAITTLSKMTGKVLHTFMMDYDGFPNTMAVVPRTKAA